MKSIAFHIEKGGTGKTTMAGNVGYELFGLVLFLLTGNVRADYLVVTN